MAHNGNDLPALRIGVPVWSVLPHCCTIHARYTNHRRHFENAHDRKLFCELWRWQSAKGAGVIGGAVENEWTLMGTNRQQNIKR